MKNLRRSYKTCNELKAHPFARGKSYEVPIDRHTFCFISLLIPPKRIEVGAFGGDGRCPTFQPKYPKCEVTFGNNGLSLLNSFYETFVGEGAFEIKEFTTKKLSDAHVASYCQEGRIFENQTVQVGGNVQIQDLEFWTEGEAFHFQLFQNGSLTA